MPYSVLVVDDDPAICKALDKGLSEDYKVTTVKTAEQGLHALQSHTFHILLLDVLLPDMSGLDALPTFKARVPDIEVIIITGHGDIRMAVDAMKQGAFDFITKPFKIPEIRIVVAQAIERIRLRNRLNVLEHEIQRLNFGPFISTSEAMRRIFEVIDKVAQSPTATVLITGATGTGKELVARTIHERSARRNQPFVALNCTALHEQLLESELFGHERGAFTDAKTMRRGLLEIADGGTVFLDEIGDMDVALQPKLLRFLEDRKFRRLGGNEEIQVDVRVIASTNRNLEKMIEEGTFREDLFYRLQVVPIQLPPLKDRPEDILPLMNHFLDLYAREMSVDPPELTPDAAQILLNYDWPGNVRELRNMAERFVIMHNGQAIHAHQLPSKVIADAPFIESMDTGSLSFTEAKRRFVEIFEKSYLAKLLMRYEGNVARSAQAAQMDRRNFVRLLNKYNLDPKTFRTDAAESNAPKAKEKQTSTEPEKSS